MSKNGTVDDFTLKKAELDHSEPIVLATFLLPYTVERDKKTGQLLIRHCFHNPTMLYATLHDWI
jgi:trehalose 6-phosphate synthase/phosphatase